MLPLGFQSIIPALYRFVDTLSASAV